MRGFIIFKPQPFMLAGEVLAFVWFGWQLGVIVFLLNLKLEWS